MEKKKIILYLTDIALHTRSFRPAQTLQGAMKGVTPENIPYGRLYTNIGPDGKLEIKIPADLQERINRGEIEVTLAFPKKGLPMFAGKDTRETVTKVEAKKRRELIHNNRKNTWHADDAGVE